MRSPIAYTPHPGPLADAGALAATAYLLAPAAVAFIFSNPLVIAGAGLATVVAGLLAGAGRALAAAGRWGLVLGVFVIAINGLVAQRGDTILVRGWELPLLGQLDISAEALAEGGVLALRILVVLAAFAIHSACVDPDRLLRLARPLARHSALTATLITRLVPLAAADYARLREAVALRGPAAAPVGRATLARRLVAGSLDRAVDVAAALELRGYGRGAPARASSRPGGRHSWRFAGCGLLLVAAAVATRIGGLGGFGSYPTINLDLDSLTLALAAALPLAVALPYAGLDRGGERRHPCG